MIENCDVIFCVLNFNVTTISGSSVQWVDTMCRPVDYYESLLAATYFVWIVVILSSPESNHIFTYRSQISFI